MIFTQYTKVLQSTNNNGIFAESKINGNITLHSRVQFVDIYLMSFTEFIYQELMLNYKCLFILCS